MAEVLPPPPPPAPMAPVEDAWSAPATGKGKKKKKGVIEEPIIPPPPPIQVVEEDHSVNVIGDGGWGEYSFDNDKKKNKKKGLIDVVPDEPPTGTTFDMGFGATNDDGFSFGVKKAKAKKGKGATEEVPKDEPISLLSPVTTNDTATAESNDWGSSWDMGGKKTAKTDKTKKGAKASDSFLPPPPPPVPVTSSFDFFDTGADTGLNNGWGTWGAKDKKKDRLMSFDDDIVDVPIAEIKEELEVDPFAGLSAKERKKKEKEKELKEKKEKEEKAKGQEKEKTDPISGFDNGWGNNGWGTIGGKDKKKKDKLMTFEDDIVDVNLKDDKAEPEADPFAGLGIREKRKKEKELKEAKEKAEQEAAEKAKLEETPVDPFAGLSPSAKKRKEKEMEKEKKEKERLEQVEKDREAKEKEEKEKAEQEAAAADPLAGLIGSARRKKEREIKEAKEKADREAAELAQAETIQPDLPAGFLGLAKKKKEKELEKERLEKERIEKEKAEKAEKEALEKEKKSVPVDPLKGLTGQARRKKEKELREAEAAKARDEEKRLEEEREKELEKERELEAEREAEEQRERERKEKKAGPKKSGWGASFMDTKSMWGATTAETKPESKVSDFLSGSNDLVGLDAGGEDDWGSTWAKPEVGKKKKVGRKEVAPPPAPTPPAQGLTPEPEAPLDEVMSWDTGGFSTFGMKNKSKATANKSNLTGKDGLKSSMDRSIDFLSALDETPVSSKDALKKTTSKEETPAKPTSRFGGWGFGSTLTKDKLAKEKAAKEEEERLAKAEDNLLLELVDDDNEPEPEPEPEPEKPIVK